MSPALLSFLSSLCIACAIGSLAYVAALRRQHSVALGHRGLMRERARTTSLIFRTLEPWIRAAATLIARAVPAALHMRLGRLLERSGDHLGVNANELIVLCLVEACLSLTVGSLMLWHIGDVSPWPLCAAFMLGLSAPYAKVASVARERSLQITRGLPEAIDLLALCLSAGLDFGSSLRLLLADGSLRAAALHDELRRVVDAFTLGHTREQALIAFAERVELVSVRELVHAVLQAERSGTPLANVLEAQARMLRQRRSVAAEEAAALAATLLLGPLCLLLGAIMLVIFGPFIVNGIGI